MQFVSAWSTSEQDSVAWALAQPAAKWLLCRGDFGTDLIWTELKKEMDE